MAGMQRFLAVSATQHFLWMLSSAAMSASTKLKPIQTVSSLAFCASLGRGVGGFQRAHSATHRPVIGSHLNGRTLFQRSAQDTGSVGTSVSLLQLRGSAQSAPKAKQIPVEIMQHGDVRVDPYAWMKDDNWQKVLRDPTILRDDIRAHLEAENKYVDSILDCTKPLQEQLLKEMKGRIEETESSVPTPDGPYAYFSRYVEGAEHPIISRISTNDFQSGVWTSHGSLPASLESLLDANELAKGKEFFKLGGSDHSPNHRLLAYSTDTKGSEYFTIVVKDLSTGALLTDELHNASGSFVWSADSTGLVYTVLDDNHREKWVYYHRLGAAQAEDVLVYEEPDDGFFLGVSKTDSGRYIMIESNDHDTSEVRMIPSASPAAAPPVLVRQREPGLQYSVQDVDPGGALVILTNADGATDFKVVAAAGGPAAAADKSAWQEVIPHSPGTLIRSISLVEGHLIRPERANALPRLVIARLEVAASGGGAAAVRLSEEHTIRQEEEAYSLYLAGGYEYKTRTVRFVYSSPTTPESTFDYDVVARQRTLRKVQRVPSGHEPSDYVCRRLTAPGHDGARIPVTVLHRRDIALDGSSPLLLYGYGSYGAAMPADFRTGRLSMVDRGVVYAVAHVRGGTDCGYAWYDPDGKGKNKKNTFLDFVAVANFLVDQQFTSKGRIAIQGGSAGGLLVGASMNIAEEGLFAAVVGEVPFIDVLNTMSDTSLPLTPPEWPEWGNPITSPEDYHYIKSYAPYEQIRPRKYPHVLATGGLCDPRVTYWEPAKWIARLRTTRTDDGLSLLKTNMGAGHAGKSGRYDKLEEVALVQAFVLMVFHAGTPPAGPPPPLPSAAAAGTRAGGAGVVGAAASG